MYKLIAIDLDGTLLNSQKEISGKNIKAIQDAMNKGIKVIICSGRIYKGARLYARQIGSRELVIACNGAIIRDMATEEALYDNSLSTEDCINVIDICHQENVYFHVYANDIMYTEKLAFGSTFYVKLNEKLKEEDRIDVRLVDNVADVIRDNSIKASKLIVVSEDGSILSRVREKAESIKSIDVVSSFYDNFEVLNKGVSKRKALEYVSQRYGIDSSDMIAIGDNENDISMITYAGLGIAVGNAEDSLKEAAGYITQATNDEDGVAEAINRFI
ncbi:MAG: Cof-type HAD-IIB family hydrolase [Bacillota bacterium]|nr:Cof-type HAD-IIB family hydrolase [Bacillota bacterium]